MNREFDYNYYGAWSEEEYKEHEEDFDKRMEALVFEIDWDEKEGALTWDDWEEDWGAILECWAERREVGQKIKDDHPNLELERRKE